MSKGGVPISVPVTHYCTYCRRRHVGDGGGLLFELSATGRWSRLLLSCALGCRDGRVAPVDKQSPREIFAFAKE